MAPTRVSPCGCRARSSRLGEPGARGSGHTHTQVSTRVSPRGAAPLTTQTSGVTTAQHHFMKGKGR